MSFVPESQLNLMRKRKQLQQRLRECQWKDIIAMETELFDSINAAVEDSQRCPKTLLKELGSVVAVYKELSVICRLYRKNLAQ